MTRISAGRRLSAALLALALLNPGPAGAQAVAPSIAQSARPWFYENSDVPMDPAWRFGVLPNGVRYAIRRNDIPARMVSIRVRVDVGSLMEEPSEAGFAHFIEHLSFRGSRDVPDGEIGEMLIRGPSAAEGYWNQREKSRATFEGGWTRSGDKYTRDADGFFTYQGRTDDMFKVSGIWVSPFEVESALAGHEAVLEAAVVPKEDADGLVKPKYSTLSSKLNQARSMVDTGQWGKARTRLLDLLALVRGGTWNVDSDNDPGNLEMRILNLLFRVEQLKAASAAL